jgi:riboflavin synthase
MFTGIIRALGTVKSVTATQSDTHYVIETDLVANRAFDMGASIACNGTCLTLIDQGPDWFGVQVSQETLNKTTLGTWGKGTKINLEASLRQGDELGGHIVLGHVDGQAEIISIVPEGGSHRLRLRTTPDIAPFIAAKGSVALDGISLTVNDVTGTEFGINIIPHTWTQTNIQSLGVGSKMNLEIDPLARYVARLLSYQQAA